MFLPEIFECLLIWGSAEVFPLWGGVVLALSVMLDEYVRSITLEGHAHERTDTEPQLAQ